MKKQIPCGNDRQKGKVGSCFAEFGPTSATPRDEDRSLGTRLRDVGHRCLWLGKAGHLSASSLSCLFRIEAYHRPRSVLAQVSERMELIEHTDLDVAISDEYGCLVANIVIA